MWLLGAIYPAVCAVAFIALGIAITWTKTPAAPAGGNLLVVRENATPLCGRLESRTKDALFVRRSKTDKADEVPRAQIQALTTVASCPADD
jgi:hypothetical protein